MRARKREFSVFSISAIDLFCTMMAVFMLISFAVLPSYLHKEKKQNASSDKKGIATMVTMRWEVLDDDGVKHQCDDLDLHVIEYSEHQNGIHYSYQQPEYPCSAGLLICDSVNGGSETWVHPCAEAGLYCVAFSPFAINEKADFKRKSYVVSINILCANAEFEKLTFVFTFDEILSLLNKECTLASVQIASDGNVIVTRYE